MHSGTWEEDLCSQCITLSRCLITWTGVRAAKSDALVLSEPENGKVEQRKRWRNNTQIIFLIMIPLSQEEKTWGEMTVQTRSDFSFKTEYYDPIFKNCLVFESFLYENYLSVLVKFYCIIFFFLFHIMHCFFVKELARNPLLCCLSFLKMLPKEMLADCTVHTLCQSIFCK